MARSSEAKKVDTLARPIPPLASELAQVEAKLREDLIRFRTCCADVRASK